MALKGKANNSNRVEYEPIPADTHAARIVGLIDIGVQPQKPWGDKEKPPVNKVVFIYEFLDLFVEDEDGNPDEEKPRWQSEILPFYTPDAEKSKIAQRYHALDPSGHFDGDYAKLVGLPALVTVTHNPKDGGGVWVNIEQVSGMPATFAKSAAELKNEPLIFDMDEPDMEAFDRIPQWIKKIITDALNYKGSKLEKLVGNAPAKEDDREPQADTSGDKFNLDDEVPF